MRGHLVSYGQASGPLEPVDLGPFADKSATVSRPNFGQYAGTPKQVRSITDRLFAAITQGVLRIHVERRLPLSEAVVAHEALEARETTGSTILIP